MRRTVQHKAEIRQESALLADLLLTGRDGGRQFRCCGHEKMYRCSILGMPGKEKYQAETKSMDENWKTEDGSCYPVYKS